MLKLFLFLSVYFSACKVYSQELGSNFQSDPRQVGIRGSPDNVILKQNLNNQPRSRNTQIAPTDVNQAFPVTTNTIPVPIGTVQGVPVQSSPFQTVPVQGVPVQGSPFQTVPVQGVPVQSGPFQTVPVQSGPFQTAPVQGVPVQGIPQGFQTIPEQSIPIQNFPGSVQAIPVGTGPSFPVQQPIFQTEPETFSNTANALPVQTNTVGSSQGVQIQQNAGQPIKVGGNTVQGSARGNQKDSNKVINEINPGQPPSLLSLLSGIL